MRKGIVFLVLMCIASVASAQFLDLYGKFDRASAKAPENAKTYYETTGAEALGAVKQNWGFGGEFHIALKKDGDKMVFAVGPYGGWNHYFSIIAPERGELISNQYFAGLSFFYRNWMNLDLTSSMWDFTSNSKIGWVWEKSNRFLPNKERFGMEAHEIFLGQEFSFFNKTDRNIEIGIIPVSKIMIGGEIRMFYQKANMPYSWPVNVKFWSVSADIDLFSISLSKTGDRGRIALNLNGEVGKKIWDPQVGKAIMTTKLAFGPTFVSRFNKNILTLDVEFYHVGINKTCWGISATFRPLAWVSDYLEKKKK